MEPLTLKMRQAVEDDIECWDDDGDLQGIDDVQFRTASTATSITSSSAKPSNHRDSISSHLSTRSDLDSNGGGDEDWQVLLPDDDDVSTKDAIASAKSAGIPIPTNVPKSALLGGTIKRLGGRRIKKALGDDWSEDLELPSVEGELKLSKNERREFPDTLRQISAAFHKSPVKTHDFNSLGDKTISAKGKTVAASLDQFRDTEEDDSLGDVPTIKIAKSRSPQRPITFAPPPVKPAKVADHFEDDLEFPADGEPLKLSTRKEIPRTPHSNQDDFDTEWAEGSLGTRFGGTKRDGRSNRSSSISALSPSVSSCLTAESEDEGLDGLILPDGPLKFDEVLKKRQQNQSPDHQAAKRAAAKEDFFSGLEIGDGDVFDSGKLTLNRNIKHKMARPTSPARRTATTLTFTNKPQPTTTRIPRLYQGHDRPRSTLEPVSESGAPLPKYRRPESRLGGHSTHSSISSIPTPTIPSTPSTPSTPSRRGLSSKASRETLRNEPRNEPTTTSAQLLKAKRSMPAMRNLHSPGKPPPYARPPSRNDSGSRPPIPSRPKTPTDRSESSLSIARRPPVPFLPAGASQSQSHHISNKTSRHFRRHDSDGSSEANVPQRSVSRISNLIRPETPGRGRKELAPEALLAAAKRTITKPTRRRNFGDGTELEIFDDLPTSNTVESKFIKQPAGRGLPKSIRSKLGQSLYPPPSRTETPSLPATPLSPTKPDYTPRFARDTAASRIAREQRTASVAANPRDREGGPLAPLSTNWKTQIAVRGLVSPSAVRNGKTRKPGGVYNKPHLIKPLGNGVHEPKSIKGMHYNPILYRWEGNENALASFDAPSLPSPKSPKPAPALITNVGAVQGVQVVGGMVFDPQRMCWLKMAPSQPPGKGGVATVADDEEDVFAGLDDLEEKRSQKTDAEGKKIRNVSGESHEGGSGEAKTGDSSDEWLVSEEFDVGPEFIRRQWAEEEKWRRKVERWIGPERRESGGTDQSWRWAIRDVV